MNPFSGQLGDREAGSAGSAGAADLAAALGEHGRWLRTVLSARGVERSALDDALQAVFAAAAQAMARGVVPRRTGPWLYRIAATHALEHRRRAGRRRRLLQRYATDGGAPAEAVDGDPLAWLMVEETQQLVRRAIALLGAQDAEILLLKYTEDWSYRELSLHLGLSESAVEARLHRARGRLRAALARVAPELVAR